MELLQVFGGERVRLQPVGEINGPDKESPGHVWQDRDREVTVGLNSGTTVGIPVTTPSSPDFRR